MSRVTETFVTKMIDNGMGAPEAEFTITYDNLSDLVGQKNLYLAISSGWVICDIGATVRYHINCKNGPGIDGTFSSGRSTRSNEGGWPLSYSYNGSTSVSVSRSAIPESVELYFTPNGENTTLTVGSVECGFSVSNTAPTAVLNVGQPLAGKATNITWTFADADGDAVSTLHLFRRARKAGQSGYTNTNLTYQAGARSYTDLLDASYIGASVYYVLTFEDAFGAQNTVTSPTYTVISNTAPGTPGAPQLPAEIMGGQSVNISWTASVDTDGNLAGYKLERSTDGGTNWQQIYQGAANSAADTIPTGTQSVAYRVKAYDTYNFESNWAASAVRTVINNRAPNAPASITIPAQVSIATAVAVSWAAVTDPDGDAITYVLERAVGGTNTWTQIYSGANTSYSDDAVSSEWVKVRYRVKAVDSRGASSGYVTSPERVIITNDLPVIDTEEDAAQGTQNEPFTLTYSVDDPDASQTLTVTEKVDGVSRKTFTAERDTEYTFGFTDAQNASYWNNIRNGEHVIRIEVSDGVDTAFREFDFTKAVTSAVVSMTTPRVAADTSKKITACVLSVDGDIPEGALTVEVTNNALDEEPEWEDATSDVIVAEGTAKQFAHTFVNTTHANGYAFNFRVTAEQVDGVGGNITSIQGGFNVES